MGTACGLGYDSHGTGANVRISLIIMTLAACGMPAGTGEPHREVGSSGGALDAGSQAADFNGDSGVIFFASDGRSADRAGLSCWSILGEGNSRGDGVYWIDPSGSGQAYRVYCDMTRDGGGWTLLAKMDGNQDTFHFASPLWTNREILNPASLNLDPVEMKSEAAVDLPVAELQVGMQESGHVTRYVRLNMKEEKPLRMYFFYGRFEATEVGREAWKGMMVSSSLQVHCNREGFNNGRRLRIGILGNQENNCASPDSWLGLGSNADGHTVGNMAIGRYDPDDGERDTRAWGFIFGR